MTKAYKLVITGAFNAGKTTFVNTLSDIDVVDTDKRTYQKSEVLIKPVTTVALDYGRVQIKENLKVHLFGTPGQARFDFMHDILAKGMHGFIFLIDSTDEGNFDEVIELLNLFKKRSKVPYLLVANKADLNGLSHEEIRKHLKFSDKQPIVPCTATDEASVQAVVECLVAMVETDRQNTSENKTQNSVLTIPVDIAQTQEHSLIHNDVIEDKVDVGGFRLYYKCMGKGMPTVVLDAGLGRGSEDWRHIQPEIAKITRVFAYDRAGRGQSDPGPFPRTSRVIVGELDRLLTKAAIDGPYVLVGNSFGAFNLRLYTHQYPEKVKGMVTIDCPHEDLYPRFKAICSPEVWEQFVATQENNDEGVSVMESIAELVDIGSLGDRPLAVLTGSYLEYPSFISKELAKQGWQIWQEMHKKLMTLSSNSFQIVAERSGHTIFVDQPELVLQVIRRVVEIVR